MKILHVCNWCSGITTNNVDALKAHSKHSHELVTRITHPYDMALDPAWLTEANTDKDQVLALAEEADVLHFHVTGYKGTKGLPQTIHGIDWSVFLGKKPFIAHGMCSYLVNGNFALVPGTEDMFSIPDMDQYTALMGPHLSCKKSYEERLHYVPDILPINDWLYTPLRTAPKKLACTFKEPQLVAHLEGIHSITVRMLRTPTKLPEQLAWRRQNCRVTFDNSRDGHWGLFGIESLSQGIPCAVYTHPMNRECWRVLGVPDPPFEEIKYGGSDLAPALSRILGMSEDHWGSTSRECRKWVEDYYNPKRLVWRWDEVYGEILHQ